MLARILSLIAIGSAFVPIHSASYAEETVRMDKARVDYMLQCQGCHQADGAGIPNSVPDLKVYGQLLLSTEIGRRYYVSVPGASKSPLTDAELAEVVNYVIEDIIEPGNAKPIRRYTVDEVSKYRRSTIADVAALRAQILSDVDSSDNDR